MRTEEFDLQLPSGRVHAKRHGDPSAPLVLCIPGLSANLISFDHLAEENASDARQYVALDLRGRGRSEVTEAGTYGWVRHARDVFAVADALGAARFVLVGHSMGAAVAKAAAQQDAQRVSRMVLIDHCGIPEERSLEVIRQSVARLGTVHASTDAYIGQLRSFGAISPWSEHWERYFRYELHDVDGGVSPRTDRAAVLEDAAFGAGAYAFGDDAAVYRLWRHLSMPVLLLRAEAEIMPGYGCIVSRHDAGRFAELPTATVQNIDANHYTIVTSAATAKAVSSFVGAA